MPPKPPSHPPSPEHHRESTQRDPVVAEQDGPAPRSPRRLGVGQLSAYGSGIIAYQFPHSALAVLAMPIFNVEMGLSPVVVGAVLMIGRLWDAFTNPWIGTLSDNTRHGGGGGDRFSWSGQS